MKKFFFLLIGSFFAIIFFTIYNSCKEINAKLYFKDVDVLGDKNLLIPNSKWNLHLQHDYYYLLNCFKDDKIHLKKIDSLRYIILLKDIKKDYTLVADSINKINVSSLDSSITYETTLRFIRGTSNFGTKFEKQNRDYYYIHNELVVSSFYLDSLDYRKLKKVYFDPNETKIEVKQQYLRGTNIINLYFDYDDLDKATLQRIYNTIKEMNYQKQNKEFTYYIYNNYEDKQVDVYIKYGDFGKWFEWRIM